MKAVDYANIFTAAGNLEDGIAEVGTKFVIETGHIIKSRKAQSSSAILAVIKEQSDKWRAFSQEIGGVVKPEGYLIIMRKAFPDIAEYI